MYYATSHLHHLPPPEPPLTCAQGHSSTLIIPTDEGGSICLLCLSNLISNPRSHTVHVSYALSQLSIAISQPSFRQTFFTFHSHFLISPLVGVLSSFDDEPIAKQTMDLIMQLCESPDSDVHAEFVSRLADRLSSGSLAWSQRQFHTLHCLGLLLDYQKNHSYCLEETDALIFNLVSGLHLSSEDIQGEILFVLYKLFLLNVSQDDEYPPSLFGHSSKLLHVALEVLMKAQSDGVRLNCIAFLTVIMQRGFFQTASMIDARNRSSYDVDHLMETNEQISDGPLVILFAEAVKAPLLSSDNQVQIAALDLLYLYLSGKDVLENEIQVFVEENIADYTFEVLRLSGCKDPTIKSCIQLLDLLATAEQAFRQRLAIGFMALIPVLHHVAEIPFHPVQTETLRLISNSVENCPGVVSKSQVEDISLCLTGMLKKNLDGEIGMLPETFTLVCSIFVALMKCSSSSGISSFFQSIQDASRNCILTCLINYDKYPGQFLNSLYLLKEAYAYSCGMDTTSSINTELRRSIIDVCRTHILPWFMRSLHEMEDEDIPAAILENFYSILLQGSDIETKIFANVLLTSSWFSFAFGCLGFFPSEKMKRKVYLIFSVMTDIILGDDSGQFISDAAPHLPSDPLDLLFLLGHKSSQNVELTSRQLAVLLLLYISSLFDDRIADDKVVLASLEQYILVNSSENMHGGSVLEIFINLYALYRGLAKLSYQIPYSPEAERIVFQLLAEKDWDLLSTRIHVTSLKWLFQQEKVCNMLSAQILKFCRYNCSDVNQINIHGEANQKIDVYVMAELVASGDNFLGMLMVFLLGEVGDQYSADDIVSVVNIIRHIIEITPSASDQFCMHGIAGTIKNLYYKFGHSSSPDTFMATSVLVSCILLAVHSESLSDDEPWVAIVVKIIDYLIPSVAADGWTPGNLISIGILSMVLHHSVNQVMVEASKTILLSTPLLSLVNTTIANACSKGPSLVDQDEGTRSGEALVFVLSLLFFSLRSLHAVLPGIMDFQFLLDPTNVPQPCPHISIQCHDLCKLLHFGSIPVKLLSSQYLLELFSGIEDERSRKSDTLEFRTDYLLSIMAVLEGQIFSSDMSVAMNCSLCLSMLIEWQDAETEVLAIQRNNWCRFIVEELVMSLAAPSLASKSFMIHHKPAIHIAVALLRRKKVPQWMTSIFDESCIFSIARNITNSNLSAELVFLLRELLNYGFLSDEQVAALNQVFQECRKCIYTNKLQRAGAEEKTLNIAAASDYLGKVCQFLISLMMTQPARNMESTRFHSGKRELLEEIDLFSKCLMRDD
ncbi:protein PUTATIVE RECOMBINATION INITIATION DEFECT 1 [Lycium ferocissimum]|uniref:protein PUTATIVE RECOMBINATION INITIATION DEFECT 1 n=1 Tax=Lycium ferocissimum TaxID=112874 RepID=UPI00281520E6|nr:protein PUTATIVE RECOMBINATION INITIATION DEFECT 1 [Lycium ferocissimum]